MSPPISSQFITPDSPLWTQALESLRHDFYHTADYLRLSAKYEGGSPLAFLAEESGHIFFAPLLIKELPPDLNAPSNARDATTPYGYACPLVSDDCGGPQLRRFLEAFSESSRLEGIVAAFLRLHPLLPLPQETLGAMGELVFHGETVYQNLTLSREEIWQQTRNGHRSEIRKLEQGGYRAVMDEWDWYDEFVALYWSTMQRLQASKFYFFSPEYFRALRECFPDQLHLSCVLAPDGGLAAAALFLTCGDIVQYHLSASNINYAKSAPTKLILDSSRWWAKERGYRLLHFGGGLGAGQDSLFAFKAGFSNLRSQYWTYRLILDDAQYVSFTDRRHQIAGTKDAAMKFFPAYRC